MKNHDLKSQLMADSDFAISIVFKICKSSQAVILALSAEVIAFADVFNDVYGIRSQLG